MATDISAKFQNMLWWIASVAISVLCCAVLFVLFASYLVDSKAALKNDNDRIVALEKSQDELKTELDLIRKHAVLMPTPSAPAAETQPAADDAGTPAPASTAAPVETPPADVAPAPAEHSLPAVTPPALPQDKK